ncbi:class I SAM-dependent methyltransferase, partial [Methanoculleus chikugoensis]|uniref:class I SAM-dependent methyltransferase n=1 Tax=Methanoculleus chikugoensis TaxID=118126 RepID=UPI000A950804
LNKYNVQYFQCPDCEYICTDDPHWLQEAYINPINCTDTGILLRNIYDAKITSCILYCFFSKDANCLDYGGGYGILTRLMRDIGFNYYWHDPNTQNMFARGFEYPQYDAEIDVVTSFESFEHFVRPLDDIANIFAISHNVIFSTELLPRPVPKPDDWWYYGLEHGQHVSFYSQKTLQVLARKFGVNYYSSNNIHIFTPKKINKIMWILICKLYWLIFPLVKFKMVKKTFQDMEFLIKLGRGNA